MNRPICIIAKEIDNNWKATSKSGIYFGVKPYLGAMFYLNTMQDSYGMDSADSVVSYFLANAGTWKGETAKRIKAELNQMLKESRAARR